jgi:regulator of protease activity HflC (stomatin/prohibitin superfamily)
MIEQIVTVLLNCWRSIIAWAILDEEQVGFIRKLGRPHRYMTAGWNWKIPIIEEACIEDGRVYPYLLDPQSLQTGDNHPVVVRMSVTCQVIDVVQYVTSVYDGRANIQDVAAGILGDVIASADLGEVLSGEVLPRVLRRVRTQAKKWGMKIDAVKFVDAARTRSFRLWQSTFQSTGQD